jgi:cyclopropane fatty-acyl-phospholipid synthase-like methyltransferase
VSRESLETFYQSYAAYKRYQTPAIKAKQIAWYDREVWSPARCTPETAVLELGCGPGEFLLYLHAKGTRRFLGIDMDADAIAAAPAEVAVRIRRADIWDFFADAGEQWDRVVMLDVLEHFSPDEGRELLARIKAVLALDGRVIIRVPNMGSPWGGLYQYGDLTHKAAYSELGLRQLATAAGYELEHLLAQRRGSPIRRFCESCLHAVLSRILTVAPTVWSANIIAIFRLPHA